MKCNERLSALNFTKTNKSHVENAEADCDCEIWNKNWTFGIVEKGATVLWDTGNGTGGMS